MRGYRFVGPVTIILFVVAWGGARGKADVVSHWLFDADHVAGSVASDLVGDFDATIHGTVRLSTDPDALGLDGRSNYLSMGSDVAGSLPVRDWSSSGKRNGRRRW